MIGCATCGAAPIGTFRDGSPMYPASCDHPPIRALDGVLTDSTIVTLTPADIRDAQKVAARVAEKYRTGKVARTRYVPPNMTIEQAAALGFEAELAVARWTGLPWNRGNPRKADCGVDVEARSSHRRDAPLILYDFDKGERRFVLVTGSSPTWQLVGWVEGRAAMNAAHWHPKGALYRGYILDYPRWIAEPIELRSMTEFEKGTDDDVSEASEASEEEAGATRSEATG